MPSIRPFVPSTCVVLFAVSAVLWANPNDPRVQLANLVQDMSHLKGEVAQMKLEMEQLRQENQRLRNDVKGLESSQRALAEHYVTMTQMNRSLNVLRQELQSATQQNRSDILKEVSRNMDELANETEKSMRQLASSVSATSNGPSAPRIDPNQDGIPYTVKKNDTLSGIASQFNSTVEALKKANNIVNPRTDLRAGQVIFVPKQ